MQYRGSRSISVRDTPYNEPDIILEVECPSMRCHCCDTYRRIRPEAIHPSRAMTWRFMEQLCTMMTECSARLLAARYRISESSVLRADREVPALIDKAKPVSMEGRTALIIDEKYLGSRRKFVTCVVDGYTGEILRLAEGKGADSLRDFFGGMTQEEKDGIEVVSVDRGNAYMKAVREHLPAADLSFDPFHIIKNINDAVTEVRRAQYRAADKLDKSFIKGQRFLLLKAGEKLDDDQKSRLKALLDINGPIQTAYLLKEQAREIYKLYYLSDAAPALAEWLELAAASGLKPFRRLAKTMGKHVRSILNYFRHKLSSGRIEGVNSMIARVLHKTRGIGSTEHLRLKLRALTSPVFRLLMGRVTDC